MSKYGDKIDDDHWEQDGPEGPPAWVEDTSANIDMEVTLHEEGYQNDRRWTVHIRRGHRDHPVAIYAGEHQNKGNYWRDPNLWRDAVDFVELPDPVQQRVASMLNRSVERITPEQRLVHRDDGTGVGDRAGDQSGTCEVCGGPLYGESDADRHEACKAGDLE